MTSYSTSPRIVAGNPFPGSDCSICSLAGTPGLGRELGDVHTIRYSAAFARQALAANSRPVISERRIDIFFSGLRQSVGALWFLVSSGPKLKRVQSYVSVSCGNDPGQ